MCVTLPFGEGSLKAPAVSMVLKLASPKADGCITHSNILECPTGINKSLRTRSIPFVQGGQLHE